MTGMGAGNSPDTHTAAIAIQTLDDLAFLYTASELGNCSGIRFGLSVPEAQRWCSSDVSRGVLHGTEWCYMWTRASTYVGVFGRWLDLRDAVDNGKWDDLIIEAGLTKISLDDLVPIARRFNVQILRGEATAPASAKQPHPSTQLSLGIAA